MPQQRVTFTTVPANAISNTSRASGQLLSYDLIVGIKVGGESVSFRHPDYELQVNRGARQTEQQIMMPSLMAKRLIPFARACFVPSGRDYDGADFTMYVFGYQETPKHRAHGALRLATVRSSTVEEMRYHVIGDDNTREVICSFIGLRDQRALCVFGRRSTFGITTVRDLMRVYGGHLLGRVSAPV